ncbi:MAG TPA: hypothetical protein VH834_10735 [Solirubrobacteraceae bacterium]|jgi:hypothetical protein
MSLLGVAPVLVALALAASAPAATQRGVYATRTVTEPAASGLAVTAPLSDFVATSRARVIVPTAWQRRSAPAGQLRFLTTQNAACRYTVTYTVKSVLAPSQDAAAYVAARLVPPTSRHLLDAGARGNRAFRVVRQAGIGGRVRLDALWAGVLTKRSDIAPAGQTAWTEIRVSAVSRSGDECHSGTWREALGPTIGDSLAVARTGLRFARKP